MKYYFLFISIILSLAYTQAQDTDANLFGDVQSNGKHVPFVTIALEGTTIGTTTDNTGHYMLVNLPTGEHVVVVRAVGYKTASKKVNIIADKSLEVNFVLEEKVMNLDDIVVTGTKTFKRKTESPVIVNVLDSKTLEMVQACNISEGLKFQPGLRVETNCQTCNYTQLRMNGLGGSYSQILINGRPIFSPLTGLYGMEQIPANMVERIEVVRGGGSALYGSSAIGGTVNILTKIPDNNAYEITYNQQSISGSPDKNFMGNINMVSKKRNAGAAIFIANRNRDAIDLNDDNFSEIPQLKNNSFGGNLFFKPTYNQKLELSFSSLYEYRYGGEIVDKPAHMAEQSEDRTHNVLMGGLDYQINFNEDNSSFIFYLAGQDTKRKHYTGATPEMDDVDAYNNHFFDPPYGYTDNNTYQGGIQVNHRIQEFLGGTNVITAGGEYIYDYVFDSIPAFKNHEINQTTENVGLFLQSDWEIRKGLTLLTGLRADKHNMVDRIVFNPRVSFLYNHNINTQYRLTWSTGFRAPQAFDTDMHMSFAAGGISKIVLGDDLNEETSNSLSASVNYDKPTENYVYGFTLEGFYTKLNDAFYLHEVDVPASQSDFGQIFEKRNGPGATVQGITLELRGNYQRKYQVEAGYTLQTSMHDEAVEYIDGLAAKKEYLRTPNQYGYVTLTANPSSKLSASLSGVYTGKMDLVHMAGAPETPNDVYFTSPVFFELNTQVGYTFGLSEVSTALEVFTGVKNILNQFQDDFDTSKNRDSNYVYGPGLPITFYAGIKLKSL